MCQWLLLGVVECYMDGDGGRICSLDKHFSRRKVREKNIPKVQVLRVKSWAPCHCCESNTSVWEQIPNSQTTVYHRLGTFRPRCSLMALSGMDPAVGGGNQGEETKSWRNGSTLIMWFVEGGLKKLSNDLFTNRLYSLGTMTTGTLEWGPNYNRCRLDPR